MRVLRLALLPLLIGVSACNSSWLGDPEPVPAATVIKSSADEASGTAAAPTPAVPPIAPAPASMSISLSPDAATTTFPSECALAPPAR